MQLVQADIEFLHHMSYDVQHQLRHIGGEESIETATDAIVIEVLQIASSSSQAVRGQTAPPILPTRRSAHVKAECCEAATAGNAMSEPPSAGCRRGKCFFKKDSNCMRSSSWFTIGRTPMVQVRNVCPPARAREPRCEGRAIDFFFAFLRFIRPSVIDGPGLGNVQFPEKFQAIRLAAIAIDVSRENLNLRQWPSSQLYFRNVRQLEISLPRDHFTE